MSTYAVLYTYDERSAEREELRPQHRAHLMDLASRGRAPAFGRFEDDHGPGALIVLDVDDRAEAEEIVAADPYVIAGLVPQVAIRAWPASGPWAS